MLCSVRFIQITGAPNLTDSTVLTIMKTVHKTYITYTKQGRELVLIFKGKTQLLPILISTVYPIVCCTPSHSEKGT